MVIRSEPVPLRVDEDGSIRVGNSRVLLDLVIRSYQRGSSPERIAQSYPTVDLADVYAVVSYYLRHREEVHDYLERRDQEAEELRRQIESHQPDRPEMRERLQARLAEMKNAASDN